MKLKDPLPRLDDVLRHGVPDDPAVFRDAVQAAIGPQARVKMCKNPATAWTDLRLAASKPKHGSKKGAGKAGQKARTGKVKVVWF